MQSNGGHVRSNAGIRLDASEGEVLRRGWFACEDGAATITRRKKKGTWFETPNQRFASDLFTSPNSFIAGHKLPRLLKKICMLSPLRAGLPLQPRN